MNKLTPSDLMTLERYSKQREQFRAKVILHKKNRRVTLGENATLYFEDQLTIQYQIQEMLRIEKIFEEHAINEELDAYNPLIPDGNNLKSTFMIEYADINERKIALEKLIGIEDLIWIQVAGFDKIFAIADEDMERESAEKTSAVHFMRFEFTNEMTTAAKKGSTIEMGSDHQYLNVTNTVSEQVRNSLISDFN